MFATHMPRSLLCWVVKPVTFPILAFTKRVKQAILLGGETCDISNSRIRNKMCQGTCYVGWWNLWHFSFSYSQQNVTRSLLCWVVKPVTFSDLVFATKCVKERVILGAETCDISHSRETTGSESDTGIWDFAAASHLQSAVSLVEMIPPLGTGGSPDRDRTTGSESDTGIWDFVTASLTYSRQFHL